MKMEIAEGQRFPQQFVRALYALGGAAVLFTLFGLPVSHLGFPLFLLTLLGVHASSRFDRADSRDRFHLPAAECAFFLAALLFDGEAAVLLAGTVAACTALLAGGGLAAVGFRAAAAAFSAFAVVWALRLGFGVIPDLVPNTLSGAALNGACVGVLTLSVLQATLKAVGGAYRIDQPVWRNWAVTFFWKTLANLSAAAAALLAAHAVVFAGVGAAISVGALASIAAHVLSARLGRRGEAAQQPAAADSREKASRS